MITNRNSELRDDFLVPVLMEKDRFKYFEK